MDQQTDIVIPVRAKNVFKEGYKTFDILYILQYKGMYKRFIQFDFFAYLTFLQCKLSNLIVDLTVQTYGKFLELTQKI